ncbi:MAG: MBL fold metallo-hydrolase [Bacteroidales bacterium]|jgi:L-ascorbate metabolism protein UlaG (beta-lactamase superfamily)|nr:MBL fold metallo-hydrolase [Bacteroidales bacterium]
MKRLFFTLILFYTVTQLSAQLLFNSPNLAAPAGQTARIEVTYIANSGFLLASGDVRILLDALYLNGDIWETPEPKVQKAMIKGLAPFQNISHMLVSHYHADHFDASLASRFLINNPKALLITNPQTDSVLNRIYRQDPELKRESQVKILKADLFGSDVYKKDNLKVTTYVQRHMGIEDYKVENLSFLIEMGGKKILHIGDAAYTEENFAGFGLEKEKIDIAFIHYWFLLDCEGRRIIDNYIKPQKIVVTHIPYDELRRNYKRIKEYYPDVEVFLNHLEKKIY